MARKPTNHIQEKLDRSVLSVTPLDLADANDIAFWKSRTPAERMEALMVLRRVLYGEVAVTGKIQKVIEIIERPTNRPATESE